MTTKEAKKAIKEAGGKWSVFLKWMYGQTVGLYPNGQIDYFDCDVERFIKYRCNPKNEPLEDWD